MAGMTTATLWGCYNNAQKVPTSASAHGMVDEMLHPLPFFLHQMEKTNCCGSSRTGKLSLPWAQQQFQEAQKEVSVPGCHPTEQFQEVLLPRTGLYPDKLSLRGCLSPNATVDAQGNGKLARVTTGQEINCPPGVG